LSAIAARSKEDARRVMDAVTPAADGGDGLATQILDDARKRRSGVA